MESRLKRVTQLKRAFYALIFVVATLFRPTAQGAVAADTNVLAAMALNGAQTNCMLPSGGCLFTPMYKTITDSLARGR